MSDQQSANATRSSILIEGIQFREYLPKTIPLFRSKKKEGLRASCCAEGTSVHVSWVMGHTLDPPHRLVLIRVHYQVLGTTCNSENRNIM